MKKIFLSETTWPRDLIFGMKHHLVNFNGFVQIISLGPGVTCFTYAYIGKT